MCTPVGGVLSTLALERLGHKNCMILSNVPFVVSQLVMVYAEHMSSMYASSALMGLSIGFACGPFSAYIGEVCEPKLRGALMSASTVFYFFGATVFTAAAAVVKQWRPTVLMNLSIPIVTVLILLVVITRTRTPRLLRETTTHPPHPTLTPSARKNFHGG